MATNVPKIRYAGRNKSKSKNSDESTDRKPQGPNSDLFAHMNQDNLNYIKDQIKIKQKQKKLKEHQRAKSSQQQEDQYESNPKFYDMQNQIEEKDSRLEETERELDNSDAEVEKENQKEAKREKRREKSDAGESNKISYYDLVSQAKSKRVLSIEADMNEESQNEEGKKFGFLGFLETYINELNESKDKSKPLKQTTNQNMNKNDTLQKQLLINKIKEEKNKTFILASELEKQRKVESQNSQKIQQLETVVEELLIGMSSLKKQLEELREQRKNEMDLKMNRNSNKGQKLSYRTNYEDPMISRFLKKSRSESEDIIQLERQLRAFEENGEICLKRERENWF